jgi:flagella basal body P-ring formation protein FlgA
MVVSSQMTSARGLPGIKAQAQLSVAGDRVTLGTLLTPWELDPELASRLDSNLVTSAPPPGQKKIVAAADILRRLDSIGITNDNYSIDLPPEIEILRRYQTITPVDVAQQVKRQFLSQLRWRDVQLERIEVQENTLLPVGETEWLFHTSPNTDYAKPFYLNINFKVDGEIVKRVFLKTLLSIQETVAVAAEELKASQAVKATDIRWEKVRLPSTLHSPVKGMDFLRSRRPRLDILPGRILTQDLFMTVPLIKRGDVVLLVYENRQMRLTAQGKSLASGGLGQQIRVVNPDSGKVLVAEVLEEGTARVVF